MNSYHSHTTTPPVPESLQTNLISRQAKYFFEKSEEPWAVKSDNFKFIYANQAYYRFLQISEDTTETLTNLGYEAVPALMSLKEKLITHDKKVIQTGQRLEAIGTFLIGGTFKSFIFEKYPFFNELGVVVGTISHLKPFKRLSMGYFLEMPFYGEATFTPPSTILTKREWEVLFLLYRGLHRSHIANNLNISEFSARNIISRLFLKTGVNSKEQLLNIGLKQGWHLYVPPRFVSIGYDILFRDNI